MATPNDGSYQGNNFPNFQLNSFQTMDRFKTDPNDSNRKSKPDSADHTLSRDLMQNNVRQHLQSRPDRKELVNRGILNGQDQETTNMVKKCLSDHLASRPGPLDVYQHLVATEDPASKKERERWTAYQRAKTLLMCKAGALSNTLNVNINKGNFDRIYKNLPKIKSLKFHEFVPGKSGSSGKFVRRKWDGSKDAINTFSYVDHYRQLIEQQALFLQMEVAEKQNLNNANSGWPTIDDDKNSTFDQVSLGAANTVPQMAKPNNTSNSFSTDFFNVNFDNMDETLSFKPSKSLDQHTNDNPLKFDEDYFDDFSSSGYGTSILLSDSFDNDDNHNLGFGMFYDCDSFNSVLEKIAHYERLQKMHNKFSE